jgi:hypothetical protein
MKLNIFILYICFTSLLVSSCKDFLTTTDPTKIGKDRFFKDLSQIDQAMNGVYGQLQGITNTAYLFGEMASDNTSFDFNPLDRGGAAGWEAIEFSTVNPGNGEISALYNNHYSALYNINNTLEKLSESPVEETVKSVYEGQLKFMRAYYYFNLTRYFGDVILATETLNSYDKAFELARVPQTEVYALIINDLNDAVQFLPEAYNGQAGRLTKGASLALLGKVYLTNKQYPQALSTLRQILPLGYSLNANYADNFNPARKNGPESLFEVQYQGDNDLGEWSSFTYIFAPRLSGDVVTGWATAVPNGRNTPTRDMMEAYETGDLRKDISMKPGYTKDGKFNAVPYISKYNYPHTIAGRTNTNWPIIRYADVLLMLAEVINEVEGPTAEASGFLNQVRDRAGLKPVNGLSKDAFRKAVLDERRIELAFENHRWFDLKRTMTPAELATFMNSHGAKEKANPTIDRGGIGFNELDYVYSDFEYYLPIPALQIQINPRLTQNEGYK